MTSAIEKKAGFKRGAHKPHMCFADGNLYAFTEVEQEYLLAVIYPDERGKSIAAIVQTYGNAVTGKTLRHMGIRP